MRVRIYVDGRPDWSTNVPSEPLPARGWFMGALVSGESSKPVPARDRSKERSTPEQRAAAYRRTKRYRERVA